MRYENDPSEIRDKNEALKDAQDEIAIAAIEKQIKLIEDEIEAIEKQKKALQDQQEELQKAMEATSKYYEKLIKEQEKMFDDMIEALENTKSKWEELAEVEEISKAWGLVSDAMGEFGYTVEDVLNDTPGAFEAFKDRYISVLAEMHSGDQGFLDGLKQTTGQMPGEFNKVATAASEAKEPIEGVGNAAGTAAGKVSSLGTSASTASTGVDELKKASEGIDESLSKVEQVDFTELRTKLGDVTADIQKAIDLIGDETKTVSLYGALNSLNTLTFDGLITSFMLLKNAVSGVLSALTGAVGSSDTSAIAAGAVAGAAVVTGGESGGGLVGALKDAQDTASSTIGTGGEVGANDDGTASTESDGTVIGDFLALGGAITNATTAIGTTESEADAGDLIGSLLSLGETDTNVLQGGDQGQGVIKDWQDFNVELSEAEEHVTKMAEGLENLADSYETTLTVNLVINGEGEYTGTAKRGKSSGVWSVNVLDAIGLPSKSGDWMSSLSKNAKGTAKIPARFAGEWGYQGGKTLIAELGPELVVFPDGHAQTFDHPQIVDLPRGSVIFNHLQSQEILDPNNQIKPGSVHATGSALPSGFTPWVEDSKINTLKAKIAEIGIPTIDGIKSALRAQTEAIRSEVRNAVNNNSSAETTVNQHNTFNISGVSGEDVARQINTTLVNTFSGMSLNAYQRSMA